MTPKQAERLRANITQIKKELAADKRRWGGFYDDSRGLRYLPPALYLKLGDYSGANRYFNWFSKNFPNDMGYPIFLFEWTLALFKTKKITLAVRFSTKDIIFPISSFRILELSVGVWIPKISAAPQIRFCSKMIMYGSSFYSHAI